MTNLTLKDLRARYKTILDRYAECDEEIEEIEQLLEDAMNLLADYNDFIIN